MSLTKKKKSKKVEYFVKVEHDRFGNDFIILPDEILDSLGWKVDDTLQIEQQKDGIIVLTKVHNS